MNTQPSLQIYLPYRHQLFVRHPTVYRHGIFPERGVGDTQGTPRDITRAGSDRRVFIHTASSSPLPPGPLAVWSASNQIIIGPQHPGSRWLQPTRRTDFFIDQAEQADWRRWSFSNTILHILHNKEMLYLFVFTGYTLGTLQRNDIFNYGRIYIRNATTEDEETYIFYCYDILKKNILSAVGSPPRCRGLTSWHPTWCTEWPTQILRVGPNYCNYFFTVIKATIKLPGP